MSYQIIIEFPNKKLADKFCGQMSDGFGENFCDFSEWRQHEGTDGSKSKHYYKTVDELKRRIFFVSKIWILPEDQEDDGY